MNTKPPKRVRRLAESFKPKHYTLTLEPNRDTLVLSGTVRINGQKIGRPSQRITFHQNGLKITSTRIVRHDKKGDQEFAVSRIHHHKTLNEVRLHTDTLLYPGDYSVEMTFTGKVQPGMKGVYYSDYKAGDKQKRMVSTQFESHFARMAFPCVDEPEARATYDLTLVTPVGEPCLGNTLPRSQEEKDGHLHTTFETTPKMSSYLLAFAFGDLQKKTAKTKSGITVNAWSTKAHDLESLDFPLDVAVKTIDFFEDFFDTPYPLPKCDHIAIPDFSAAAMENWGIITYREMALLVDPKTSSQSTRELVAEVIAHEVSHQWFGDLVTMKWWDELWLNEAFANVMAFVAVDALFPQWKIWNDYIASDGLAAIRRDSIAGVQAIKTDVRHPSEINSIFDPSIVYAKGGRLIYMLMEYLGKDAFRKGLKKYFAKHAYSNTTGTDLWEALASVSDNDVTDFMQPWIEFSGFPVVKVTQNDENTTLTQSHFLMDQAKIDPDRIWPIPLLSNSETMPALLSTPEQVLKTKSKDYVRINKGAVGHYIVQYVNPVHAETIAALAAKKQLNEAERLVLLNDNSMLARAGLQSFSAALKLLDHYKSEDAEPVWSIIAVILADCRRFVDIDKTLDEPIKKLISDLIVSQHERLGWDEKADDSPQDVKLRALILSLGVFADHPDVTKRAHELFEKYKDNEQAVPTELRAVVFNAAVRSNVDGAFDFLLELDAQTNNVSLKLDVADALTTTRDEAHAKKLLGRLKDSSQVRQHDVLRWVALLVRNRHTRTLTWNWIRDNWNWISDTFADDNYDYVARYVANTFNTAQLLNEYKEFFEPKLNEPGMSRSISMGIEEITNRVAWLERDIAAVKDHFNHNA